MKQIIFFGDSLTVGYSLRSADNLEKIIQRVKETNLEVKLALLGMELPAWTTQATHVIRLPMSFTIKARR